VFKNHSFVIFGPHPIFLRYLPSDSGNAAARIRNMELAVPCLPHHRRSTPLFHVGGQPFSHAYLDALLPRMLQACGVPAADVSQYSWHSWRSTLATSLGAVRASSYQIQALYRWRSEDSMRVYRHLLAADYMDLLDKASVAVIDTSLTSSFPAIDYDSFAHAVHQFAADP